MAYGALLSAFIYAFAARGFTPAFVKLPPPPGLPLSVVNDKRFECHEGTPGCPGTRFQAALRDAGLRVAKPLSRGTEAVCRFVRSFLALVVKAVNPGWLKIVSLS